MLGFKNPFESAPSASAEKPKKKSNKEKMLATGAAAILSVGAVAQADEAIDAAFAHEATSHTLEFKGKVDATQRLDEVTGQTLAQVMKQNAKENAEAHAKNNKNTPPPTIVFGE